MVGRTDGIRVDVGIEHLTVLKIAKIAPSASIVYHFWYFLSNDVFPYMHEIKEYICCVLQAGCEKALIGQKCQHSVNAQNTKNSPHFFPSNTLNTKILSTR